MKNKKGFSLVELLIVIVIIGILAGIIIPSVTKYLRKGKDEYNKNLSTEIISIAKTYYTENKVELPRGYINEQGLPVNKALISLSYLSNNNYISGDLKDSDGNSCINNSYVIVEKNNSDYDYTACIKCDNGYESGEKSCIYNAGSSSEHEYVLPKCTLSLANGNINNWTSSDITLNLSLEDNTSLAGYYLSDGSFNKIDNLSNYTTSIKLSDTMYDDSYYVIVEDQYANQGICKLDGTIMIDKEKPTCNLSVTTEGVSITKGDNEGSGIDTYGLTTSENVTYNETNTLDLSLTTYYGYVKDKAGNTNTCSATLTSPVASSYVKTTNTCGYTNLKCWNYLNTCPSGYSYCSWCSSSKCYKTTSASSYSCVVDSYKEKVTSGDSEAWSCNSGYTKTSFDGTYIYCKKYGTCYSCSSGSLSGKYCYHYSGYTGCSYSSVTGEYASGSYCYLNNQGDSCPSGWAVSDYSTYGFTSTTEEVSSCDANEEEFTCKSGTKGESYSTCEAKEFKCSTGTKLDDNYCYTLN